MLELGLRSAEMWPAFAAALRSWPAAMWGSPGRARCCRPRRGRGARARASDRVPRLARPARRAPAPERGARARAGAGPDGAPGARGARRSLGRSAPVARGAARRLRGTRGPAARARAARRIETDAARGASRLTLACGQGGREAGVRAQVVARRRRLDGQIEGLPAHARVPVRPVKGQLLRLRDPAGPGLLRRVVRFAGGYLVPRADGRYVLGATMEERGFDTQPDRRRRSTSCCATPTSSCRASPSSRSRSCRVGLRPGTPDNAPAVGAGALEGLCGRPVTTATASCSPR